MALQKMANLDYFFLVGELEKLRGGRLAKIYELGPGRFRFKFAKEGNQYQLVAELGTRLHLTKFVEEAPNKPTTFAMVLRKYLDNAVLTSVEQVNFDRIVVLKLEKKEKYSLVFEMYGTRGNLLLCDCAGKIIQPYTTEEKGGRVLKRGEIYTAPKQSSGLNVAPFYQEEVLSRVGIGGRKPEELDESEKGAVEKEIERIKSRISEPRAYYEAGKPVAFSSIELKKFEGLEKKEFEKMSDALDEYYANFSEPVAKSAEGKEEKALKKLEFLAEQQRKTAEENEAKAKEQREIGDAVWNNLEKADELITNARKEGKKKIEVEL